ncbi:hypothetical protein BP6252_06586 [Coleophoma cylindrospora]|uniref:DH domain-containing protein n=1 Tax=Coleophoma cylindrospora TaxID=1849047 RepID=A0A3D8RNH2_9HELO|nr:hypothetical protein BP6252_06586 [Coleophoma cylindrospora]
MASRTLTATADSCVSAFHYVLSIPDMADSEWLQQQLSRFNFWAANIRAFSRSKASLNTYSYTKYHPWILELLGVLEKNLRSFGSIDPSYLEAANENDNPKNALHFERVQAVQDTIYRLQRLYASFRRSALIDWSSIAADFIERDREGNDLSTAFEDNATRIIQSRYPDASGALCRRLGQSVALRRKVILYSRGHQVELASRIRIPGSQVAAVNVQTLMVQQPMQSVTYSKESPIPKISPTFPGGIPNVISVRLSEKATSLPESHAQSTTAQSRVSAVSTGSILQGQELKYPRAPKADFLTGEASCSYCSSVLTADEASNTKIWRQHFKRDIKPYVCVADSCKDVNTCFGTSEKWAKHMQQEHQFQWGCSMAVHNSMSFDREEESEEYRLKTHKEDISPSRHSILAKIVSRPASGSFDKCPLCQVAISDLIGVDATKDAGYPDDLYRHIAGHLKSLALMFIPPGINYDDEETESGSLSSDRKSSRISMSADSSNLASLNFEDIGPNLSTDIRNLPKSDSDGQDSQPEIEWSFLSKEEQLGPKVDPVLQNFVRRARPPPRLQDYNSMENWMVFYKVPEDQLMSRSKQEFKRQNMLHEIVNSEHLYLKNLDRLRILYRDALQSQEPPIIPGRKRENFIEQVFGKLEPLKLVNENFLLHEFHQMQDTEAPWITGFSDIFHHWLQAARKLYLNYSANYPLAAYMIRQEAKENLLFQQFLDQTRNHKLSNRLDLQTYLTMPVQRIWRYCIMLTNLSNVPQPIIGAVTEEIKLSKILEELRLFWSECESLVQSGNKNVARLELQSKLILRTDMERVELNLDHLVFRGDLRCAGANCFTLLETHAILFEDYLVLTRRVFRRGSTGMRKEERYEVSKTPIPIQLLVLENKNDDPVVKSPVKGLVAVTSVAPDIPSDPSLTETQRRQAPTAMNADTSFPMYPFRIKHLGKAVYTLYASSAHSRYEWCNEIVQILTLHAGSEVQH